MDDAQAVFNANRTAMACWYSTEPVRRYHAGDESPKAKMLKEIVFDQEEYDGDWPPESAAEFIKWFEAKLAEVPRAFRESAKIELDSQSGYEDSHYVSIEITYLRPETKEEIATRRAGYAAQLEREKDAERAEFERLQAKFASDNDRRPKGRDTK